MDNLDVVGALLAEGGVGLFLDLDGTISEIVPDPEASSVSMAIKSTLAQLHNRLPLVAIVTGRSVAKAKAIVGNEDLVYVGNHGLERMEKGRSIPVESVSFEGPQLRQLFSTLRARFSGAGLVFEDKGVSFAVHYRHAPDPESSQDLLLRAIDRLAGVQVKVVPGKYVINLLPPVEANKGTAVVSLVEEHGLSAAILIGDDVTDLDSFGAARSLGSRRRFNSICIGRVEPGSPPEVEAEADYTLATVSEVESFLGWLADQVPEASAPISSS